MRDELRERLAAAACGEELADFRAMHEVDREIWLENVDGMLAELKVVMLEDGLKMLPRPQSTNYAIDPFMWDAAPLTPWGEGCLRSPTPS